MVGMHAQRCVRAGLNDCAVGDLAVSKLPGNLGRGPQLTLHANLADTSAGGRAGPEVVLSGSVDLRFEPFRRASHEKQSIAQSIWESIAPKEQNRVPIDCSSDLSSG